MLFFGLIGFEKSYLFSNIYYIDVNTIVVKLFVLKKKGGDTTMDTKTKLEILGEGRTCSTWDNLTREQRLAVHRGDLEIVSLDRAVVAKILTNRLTEEELALVMDWVEKETANANEAGWCGAVGCTTRKDLDRANDPSVLVRIVE